jgi:hypothetical protein
MNENTVRPETDAYEPPTVEVICLACEISSYAPDEGDAPLF